MPYKPVITKRVRREATMFDTGKVVIGLVVFIGFVTCPFWIQAVQKVAGLEEPLELDEPRGEHCVESAEFMRAKHMDLLNDWRNEVVRHGLRTYVAADGSKYDVSLSKTCLDCHESKADFCDKCHDYSGIRPLCWDCHVDPEEVK